MSTNANVISAPGIVARFRDHRMVKGTTADFHPDRPKFHVKPAEGGASLEVLIKDLKILCFVKTYGGNPEHVPFEGWTGPTQGRKIEVTFEDGEVMHGFTVAYHQGKPGFWLIPADPDGNNVRVFVVNVAVKSIRWGK